PRKNGAYPLSTALPDMQTFEEFYAKVRPGQSLENNVKYQALRTIADPQLAMFRVALMPPHASSEAVSIMRAAFIDLWKDQGFLADYSKVIKSDPILVKGEEGQAVLKGVASVPDDVKNFIVSYANGLTAK
ncbi:MAG: hypothetical protein J0H89_02860, partial [Rhizobiales bacterium]|nr:hypothetical protein [Hyphomicrobiales bacterium]